MDTLKQPAQYILTGSNQFLLMEQVTQSLAGRIITFMLYPFTTNELWQTGMDSSLEQFVTFQANLEREKPFEDLASLLFTGFYPPIHDRKLEPRKWNEQYIMTYVERDGRNLVNIENLRLFEDFLLTCAAYSGQLLNYAAISNAIGVSEPTVKKWLSLLETSGIIFLLRPYYRNYSKRIVKSPKLYFLDTGLLCYLLALRQPKDVLHHPLYGSIFETFLISDLYKRAAHLGEKPPFYFWRVQYLTETQQRIGKITN